jgi:hypothetical protein
VLEEKLKVVADDGMVFGTELGIATGQRDQTFLPSSASELALKIRGNCEKSEGAESFGAIPALKTQWQRSHDGS